MLAEELFFSDNFSELSNLVNAWKELHTANGQTLSDMILQYREEVRNRAAETLLHLWPYLYTVVEDLKK